MRKTDHDSTPLFGRDAEFVLADSLARIENFIVRKLLMMRNMRESEEVFWRSMSHFNSQIRDCTIVKILQ